MDRDDVLRFLDDEIARLTQARNLLTDNSVATRRGRPRGTARKTEEREPTRGGGMSAAGRRKISRMMKARWAARRKASGKKK